jgi:hypothetical protein
MSYPEFVIDKRVLHRNLAKGIVDPKEYEKQLAELPDMQENAAPVLAPPAESTETESEG